MLLTDLLLVSGNMISPLQTYSQTEQSLERALLIYNLELGHILAEGDVKDPVKSLLGQPGLVKGQLADVS